MFSSVVAIVLSYNRPNNIPGVLQGVIQSRYVSEVIVSNNNPSAELPPLPPDRRIAIVYQQQHMPAALRFFMAANLNAEAFICIDDDLFLSGDQIDRLLEHLFDDPSVPHGGPWAQRLLQCVDGSPRLKGWYYPDSAVDVLNRAYAFTKAHATRFSALSKLIGHPTVEVAGPWDDVILSHCGNRQPQAHDLGPWGSCPTSNDPEVALWLQPGFSERRMEIFWRLREGSAHAPQL
jgi:hypothetical protein